MSGNNFYPYSHSAKMIISSQSGHEYRNEQSEIIVYHSLFYAKNRYQNLFCLMNAQLAYPPYVYVNYT